MSNMWRMFLILCIVNNQNLKMISVISCMQSGGRFNNTYELLNLRALKFHLWIKSTSFNVWARYFVWNFKGTLWNSTQNILPIHWKIRFLYKIGILRALRFKSLYAFLKRPPGPVYLPCLQRLISSTHTILFSNKGLDVQCFRLGQINDFVTSSSRDWNVQCRKYPWNIPHCSRRWSADQPNVPSTRS